MWRPNLVAHGEGKEDAPHLSVGDGLEDSTDCMERQNEEYRSKAGANVKDIVVVAHSLKWKWGGRVARKDQRGWPQATSLWDEWAKG